MESPAIFTFFEQLPRQGPGSDAYTERAFNLIRTYIPDNSRILDIGCGTGAQTLILAELKPDAHITALDIYQPFLDQLQKNHSSSDIKSSPISTVQGSMTDMKFEAESFNLIWSEGAIYNMGFEQGLTYWKKFLKPGGIISVSEVIWLSENPPDKVREFWDSEYPSISTIDANIQIIADTKMELLSHFILSQEAWWENYYLPAAQKIELYQDHQTDPDMDQFIAGMKNEIQIFRRYGEFYSYAFFLMRKD